MSEPTANAEPAANTEPTADTEPAFEIFLAEVGRLLQQRPGQSRAVTDELRDHLQERLTELLERGMPRETALQTSIDELGDAAALAAEFNTVSRDLRRRWIMRYASGSIAAAVVLFFITVAFWPDTPRAPTPPQATAQDGAAPKDKAKEGAPKDAAAPARPKQPTPEENNARVEAMLVDNRVRTDFKEMALGDFFEFLRDFHSSDGKELSLEISVDTRRLEDEAKINLDRPIKLNRASMRLDRMIDHVLGQVNVKYYLEDGVMVVSTCEFVDTHLETRVYDCRDLMDLPRPKGRGAAHSGSSKASEAAGAGGVPAGDVSGSFPAGSSAASVAAAGGDPEFIRLLLSSVKPDSWTDTGGPGTVTYYRGLLVVSQSAPVHRQMRELLAMLRSAVAKQSQGAKD